MLQQILLPPRMARRSLSLLLFSSLTFFSSTPQHTDAFSTYALPHLNHPGVVLRTHDSAPPRALPRQRRQRPQVVWCSEGGGESPLNFTLASMKKRGVEWQASLWEQWDADGKNVDAMMIKNDIAVLSINTLGQAVIELISKGPKQTPGMTLSDWIIVRYSKQNKFHTHASFTHA